MRKMKLSYSGDGFWRLDTSPSTTIFMPEEKLSEREARAAAALRMVANPDGTMEGCAIEFMN